MDEVKNNEANVIVTDSLSEKPFETVSKKKVTIISLIIFVTVIILRLIVCNVFNNYNYTYGNITDEPLVPGNLHTMVYRSKWGGWVALRKYPQKLPVKYVIISHTGGRECYNTTCCYNRVRLIQDMHLSEGHPDIGHNFLICGDANIYVGREWNNHNFYMKLNTIAIAFIGNYVETELTPGMIEAAQLLLQHGVEKRKLAKDYILIAHNQTWKTQSPGKNVYKHIKFWPHFSPDILLDTDE